MFGPRTAYLIFMSKLIYLLVQTDKIVTRIRLLKDKEEIQLKSYETVDIIDLDGIDQNPVCTCLFCSEHKYKSHLLISLDALFCCTAQTFRLFSCQLNSQEHINHPWISLTHRIALFYAHWNVKCSLWTGTCLGGALFSFQPKIRQWLLKYRPP